MLLLYFLNFILLIAIVFIIVRNAREHREDFMLMRKKMDSMDQKLSTLKQEIEEISVLLQELRVSKNHHLVTNDCVEDIKTRIISNLRNYLKNAIIKLIKYLSKTLAQSACLIGRKILHLTAWLVKTEKKKTRELRNKYKIKTEIMPKLYNNSSSSNSMKCRKKHTLGLIELRDLFLSRKLNKINSNDGAATLRVNSLLFYAEKNANNRALLPNTNQIIHTSICGKAANVRQLSVMKAKSGSTASDLRCENLLVWSKLDFVEALPFSLNSTRDKVRADISFITCKFTNSENIRIFQGQEVENKCVREGYAALRVSFSTYFEGKNARHGSQTLNTSLNVIYSNSDTSVNFRQLCAMETRSAFTASDSFSKNLLALMKSNFIEMFSVLLNPTYDNVNVQIFFTCREFNKIRNSTISLNEEVKKKIDTAGDANLQASTFTFSAERNACYEEPVLTTSQIAHYSNCDKTVDFRQTSAMKTVSCSTPSSLRSENLLIAMKSNIVIESPLLTDLTREYVEVRSSLRKCEFTIRHGRDNTDKQETGSKDSKKIANMLKNKNVTKHAYSEGKYKVRKVVLRGIPPKISTDDIKASLDNLDFDIINVTRMTFGKRKPLPLLLVTYNWNLVGNKIYNIKELLGFDVAVEPYRKGQRTLQCFRCQGFNHMSKECPNLPQCVKCGKAHSYETCFKPRTKPATCVNCGGSHTANFRGCPMFPQKLYYRN